MKNSNRNLLVVVLSFMCLLPICSCSNSKERRVLEAEHDSLLEKFKSESKIQEKEALLVELLNIKIMKLRAIDSALELNDEYEAMLEDNVLGRSLVAVAQAMKADTAKEIRDKLKWLSLSNVHFDDLHKKWPNNIIVHVYHASTLAALPPEVGARDEAITLVESLLKQGDLSELKDYETQIEYIIAVLIKSSGSKEGDQRLKEVQETFLSLFAHTRGNRSGALDG